MRLLDKETPQCIWKKQGQTDQVPNLEKAGVSTQTKPDTGRKLGAGYSRAP